MPRLTFLSLALIAGCGLFSTPEAPSEPEPVAAEPAGDPLAWYDAEVKLKLTGWNRRWNTIWTSADLAKALQATDPLERFLTERIEAAHGARASDPVLPDLSALNAELTGMSATWDDEQGEVVFRRPVPPWNAKAEQTAGNEDNAFMWAVNTLCDDMRCQGERKWFLEFPDGRKCGGLGTGLYADLIMILDARAPRTSPMTLAADKVRDQLVDDVIIPPVDAPHCALEGWKLPDGGVLTRQQVQTEVQRIYEADSLTDGQRARLGTWLSSVLASEL